MYLAQEVLQGRFRSSVQLPQKWHVVLHHPAMTRPSLDPEVCRDFQRKEEQSWKTFLPDLFISC